MAGELARNKQAGLLINGGDAGNGPKIGAKYLKSAMRRYAAEHPEDIDDIAAGIFSDAKDAEECSDRLKAAVFLRDTLDGKPEVTTPMIHTGPQIQVVVVEDTQDIDKTPLPPRVVEALKRDSEEEEIE